MNAKRLKVWLGSLIVVGATLTLLLMLLSPALAEPISRIQRVVVSGLDAERGDDVVLAVETLKGVDVGAPVYFLETGHETVPVGHVVGTSTADDGTHSIRFRYAPDQAVSGDLSMRVFPPRRGLRGSYELAVSPEAARAVGGMLLERLDTLWREEIEPSLAERIPKFLARIDPRESTQAGELMETLGDDAMVRLKPLLNGLVDAVSRALDRKMDLLDRMGVLWKFVRGDRKGLKKKFQPVAEKAAQDWWRENQKAVLGALGDTFKEKLPEIRTWLNDELLPAAREELIDPLLALHRERLEDEGEKLMKFAMREVIRSNGGGFRVRFASMLRMTLLGKKQALILLERPAVDAE